MPKVNERIWDGYTMSRKIKEDNWNFVGLTGDHQTRVVGLVYAGTLRKGIARILDGCAGASLIPWKLRVWS